MGVLAALDEKFATGLVKLDNAASLLLAVPDLLGDAVPLPHPPPLSPGPKLWPPPTLSGGGSSSSGSGDDGTPVSIDSRLSREKITMSASYHSRKKAVRLSMVDSHGGSKDPWALVKTKNRAPSCAQIAGYWVTFVESNLDYHIIESVNHRNSRNEAAITDQARPGQISPLLGINMDMDLSFWRLQPFRVCGTTKVY